MKNISQNIKNAFGIAMKFNDYYLGEIWNPLWGIDDINRRLFWMLIDMRCDVYEEFFMGCDVVDDGHTEMSLQLIRLGLQEQMNDGSGYELINFNINK